jgi:hypothetical protein
MTYNKGKFRKTLISRPSLLEGEAIERKVERLVQNKEPIKDGAPLIYTERAHGINPAHNIRTDRWELAVDAMTRIEKSKQAKRDEIAKAKEDAKVIDINKGKDTKGEPTADKMNTK